MPRTLLLSCILFAALWPAAGWAMSKTVDPAEVRTAIEDAWSRHGGGNATLEVRAVPALSYEDGDPIVEVRLPEDFSRPGPRVLPVSCRTGGRVVSRGLANVVLRVELPVWVARRPLARGDELGPGDLLREAHVYDREPRRPLAYEPERRWRVTREIAAGAQITTHNVRRLRDVESGQEIYLVARAGASTVSVPGRARQSGDAGDVILVHNPLTGSLVRAVVIDGSAAEVLTPPPPRPREE